MSINELLPILQELPRSDKLRLIQFLAVELAKEDNIALLDADHEYPVWSPYNAIDAADTLLELLAQDNLEPAT
jgi:hypothetical protein